MMMMVTVSMVVAIVDIGALNEGVIIIVIIVTFGGVVELLVSF